MTSPLKEILSGTFLSFTAKNLGHQWKGFFTRLNFESHHFVHWETDNLKFSDEPIIIGLKEWIKRPLAKNLLSYRNIEEIKDWLVLILNLECGRKDISDDIQKNYKDMDEIIEMLTEKVTTDRPSLFGALEIDWKSIEDNLPTGESLKKRTGACLNTWFTEQQVKYWKYQELLLALRDSNLDSGANSIIERFGLKELKDARNYFEAAKQEALPLGKEKDSHLYANTSFVGSSDSSRDICLNVNATVKLSIVQSQGKQHVVLEHTKGGNIEIPVGIPKDASVDQFTAKKDIDGNIEIPVGIPKVASADQFSKRKDNDTNQQILIQQSPSDKELSTKSDDVGYMTNKRPLEEAIVENGECKKKVKASRKEKITETEEDMEIVHFDNIEREDMHDTHSDEDATIPDGFQKSLINLRDYQQELADLALKGVNTIVCAGTNAGKTYVALKVIESHLEKNTAGKVVFMTRTNVLLGQQFDTACKLLPGLSSKGKIQKWEAGQDFTSVTFKSLVNRCSILFLTPKSLCNFLEDEFSRVNIDQFTLLVLDECHHTYGKSPYNEIMGYYRKKKFENEQNNLPQFYQSRETKKIMRLTASPGTNRAKDKFGAKEHLIHIMTNLDVKKLSVVKECESSLLKYSSKPATVPILSKKRKKDPVKEKLMEAMDFVEDILDSRQITTYLNNPVNEAEGLFEALRNPPKDRTIERYILWLSTTKKKIEELSKKDTQALRLMHACFRHLEFYAECLEVNSLLDVTQIRAILKDGVKRLKEESIKATDDKEKELIEVLDEVLTKIYALGRRIEGNPDVEKIIEVLEDEYQKHGEESRFLIFVKTRTTAKALAEKLPEEFNSRHLTGSQVSKEEGGLSKEEQIDIVKRFKEGKHVCLVATSVASEGLDIQQCTLTIRYRLQANEISSLQMRGRIRHHGGKEVLIASQEELKREEINIERLFLMNLAIDEVLKEDVSQKIATSERNIYEMEELARQRLKTNPNSEKKGKFYITCALCGKFIIDGQYIRRIRKSHCIICDKEIFGKIDRRKTKKSQTFDEIKKTDKVYGFACGHNWGSILIYQECEFVSLSQDYMTIVNKETGDSLSFKKWSEVHMEFPLDDITDNDLIEYRSKTIKRNSDIL